jgi:hypothetical protein
MADRADMPFSTCLERAFSRLEISEMPSSSPLLSTGKRDAARPRPIATNVRRAIRMMIEGVEGEDEDGNVSVKMVDFIEAARHCEIAPDVMRKVLGRSEVQTLLRQERRIHLAGICAGNPTALRLVRDAPQGNQNAKVAAARVLEELGAADGVVGNPNSRYDDHARPGVTINVVSAGPTPVVIDGVAERPSIPSPQRPLVFVDPPHRPRPPSDDGPIFNPNYTA